VDNATQQIVTDSISLLARHAMTVIASILVADGFLQATQQANFVDISIGLLVGVIAIGWSFVNKSLFRQKVVVAAITGDQNPSRAIVKSVEKAIPAPPSSDPPL
jgi:uncharacterized protein with FMN-binding domain